MTDDVVESVEVTETAVDSSAARISRFLLRLIVVVVLGSALGTGVYLGVPAIYREFIQPVQDHTRQLEHLSGEVEWLQDDQVSLEMSIKEIGVLLEGSLAEQYEAISVLNAELEIQAASILNLDAGVSSITKVVSRLEGVDELTQRLEERVDGFEDELSEAHIPSEKLARQLQLIKAMELVTRARFWFLQDNLGKAAEDIENAMGVVDAVLGVAQESEMEMKILTTIYERLELALFTIELTPIVAADDLEIVWQLLLLATEP